MLLPHTGFPLMSSSNGVHGHIRGSYVHVYIPSQVNTTAPPKNHFNHYKLLIQKGFIYSHMNVRVHSTMMCVISGEAG